MSGTMLMIMTLVMINGTVDEGATINATFDMIHNQTEYEFNWWPKSTYEFEKSRKGDCTDAAKLAKTKLRKYGIWVKKRFGTADCWNGTGYVTVKHDWIEYKGIAYDVRQWGACQNYQVT